MKKFLNYILVAGVAVLGFVGTVSADEMSDKSAKARFETAMKAYEKDTDGTKTYEMTINVLDSKKATIGETILSDIASKIAVGTDYKVTVALSGTTATFALVDKDDNAVTIDSTAVTQPVDVKFDEKTTVTAHDNVDLTALKTSLSGKKFMLKDLDLISYLLSTKDGKTYDEKALDRATEYKTAATKYAAFKVEARLTKGEPAKASYTALISYKGVYVDSVDFTVEGGDELLVPLDTKTEDIEKVLESRLSKFGTTTVTYDKTAKTVTVIINNKTLNGAFKVTPSADCDKAATTPAGNAITSNTTAVSVTADKEVEAGTNLVVTKVENPTEAAKAVAKDVKDIVVYDIKLVNAKGETVKFDGVTYTVTVTIPENLKGKELAAYTVVDGKLEEHKITVDGDKGTFKTTHFSEWIISEIVKVDENGKVLPNTLDNAASFAFVGVIGLVGMAASALFLNKRN